MSHLMNQQRKRLNLCLERIRRLQWLQIRIQIRRKLVRCPGKNGRIRIYFAEGYENFYADKECTVLYESKEGDGVGEVVVYVAKGK